MRNDKNDSGSPIYVLRALRGFREIRVIRGLFFAALLLVAPRLATAALLNGASLHLLPRWQQVAEAAAPPECPASAAPSPVRPMLERALRWQRDHPRLLILLGRAAWLEEDCTGAREAWEQALTARPGDETAALWAFLAGSDAVGESAVDPAHLAEYFYWAGHRARQAGLEEAAVGWYRRSLDLIPSRQAASALAAIYGQRGQPEAAAAVWEEVAGQLPPEDPEHWWARGQAAEIRQEWEAAARAYEAGARRARDPYDFLMRLGAVRERLKEWEQAEAAYRQAVQARPDLIWPYLGVGHMRRAQGDTGGALEWYHRAEALAPDRYEPQYWLGFTHYLREEYAGAQEYLEAALERNPRHAWSAYYLAWSFYRQGERGRAIGWLERAIGLHPGKPWNWAVELGDWRAGAGDREGALAAYRQALEWKPEDPNILEKIQGLESDAEGHP